MKIIKGQIKDEVTSQSERQYADYSTYEGTNRER